VSRYNIRCASRPDGKRGRGLRHSLDDLIERPVSAVAYDDARTASYRLPNKAGRISRLRSRLRVREYASFAEQSYHSANVFGAARGAPRHWIVDYACLSRVHHALAILTLQLGCRVEQRHLIIVKGRFFKR